MLARRAFLGFLGFAAGAAAAVKLKVTHKAAPKPPVIFNDGDTIYRGLIIRDVDGLFDEERERAERFYAGAQWTPEQVHNG